MMAFSMIPLVRATEMPDDVMEYCLEQEYSTHYQSDVVQLELNGNPFVTWLTAEGHKFTQQECHIGWAWVGIEAS